MTPIEFPALWLAVAEAGRIALAMLIVFGAAKLLAELSEQFGQPGIVGEILGGVLIGPGVLVLLCYQRRTQQKGQQGSCLNDSWAILIRIVAMEFGLWCSARVRGATGLEADWNFRGA